MRQYLNLLDEVIREGVDKPDRTGTGTLSIFGPQLRFDLSQGFPLVTTKKVHFKSIVHELLWFLSGDTNIDYLNNNGVTIWDAWANEWGNLGPIYGAQWRGLDPSVGFGVDQISELIDGIKKDPHGRRHVVTAWNPEDLEYMRLAPCHMFFQCYISEGRLSLHMYQRSADLFLGVPFNIASYALLTMMLAQVTGYMPGDLVISFGDAHIYKNHLPQVREQLDRGPRALPHVRLEAGIDNIYSFKYEHVLLLGYNPHPAIKGEVSV